MLTDLRKSLVEQRVKAWKAAEEVLKKASDEGRATLTADEDEVYTRATAEVDALAARIKDVESRIADEARDAEIIASVNASAEPRADKAPSQSDILRAMARGERRDAEFALDGLESRDVLLGTTNLDAAQPTFVQTLIEHLVENGVLVNYATVIRTSHGDALDYPKTSAYPSAAIVAEAASIGESDPTFAAKLTLNAYKYGFMTQLSPEVAADVNFDLEGFLGRKGGQALGNGIGAHFVTGTGTGQPNGIVTAAPQGVLSVTANNYPDYDELVSLVHSVSPAYRRRGGAFLMNDGVLAAVRKIKDLNGTPIFQPGYFSGAPDSILGYPIVIDPNVPGTGGLSQKAVLFGDLSAYIVRFAGGVRIERSTDFAFANDLISWRFLVRADGDLSDTNAVKHWISKAA